MAKDCTKNGLKLVWWVIGISLTAGVGYAMRDNALTATNTSKIESFEKWLVRIDDKLDAALAKK